MFYKVVAILTYLKSPNNKLAFSCDFYFIPISLMHIIISLKKLNFAAAKPSEIRISNGTNGDKSEKVSSNFVYLKWLSITHVRRERFSRFQGLKNVIMAFIMIINSFGGVRNQLNHTFDALCIIWYVRKRKYFARLN